MDILNKSEVHRKSYSYDCSIIRKKERIIKVLYEAGNSYERHTTSLFDGDKWNVILIMLDLGVEPNPHAFITWDEKERKERANDLHERGIILMNDIL